MYAILITHPWGLYLICKRDAQECSLRVEHLQIRYKLNGCVTTALFYGGMSGSKAALACIWHEERFYTVGPVLQNDAGDLADRKPWISMPLSQNRFTMTTDVTFLTFRLSTNVPLTLLTSWLFTLYARSTLCIMANGTCMALKQSSATLTLLRLGWCYWP